MNQNKRACALALSAAVAITGACSRPSHEQPLRISIGRVDSSNPLDAARIDLATVFSSVHMGLIDRGKRGHILGGLAHSWKTSPDFRIWTFTLREDATFENGDQIQAKDIAESWRWIALNKRARKSDPGFLSRLEGFSDARGSSPIAGLIPEGKQLVLRFSDPERNPLDSLADPTFAVTHPRCRDMRNGAWKCVRETVASGPYRIVRWELDKLELALRTDYPAQLRHPKAARRILMLGGDGGEIPVDISYRMSGYPSPGPEFRFYKGANSFLGFAHCKSWTHPTSPCRIPAMRRKLRESFYRRLWSLKDPFPLSFIPSAVPGVRERPLDTVTPPPPGKAKILRAQRTGDPDYIDALKAAAVSAGLKFETVNMSMPERIAELEPGLPDYRNDIELKGVELSFETPIDSLRSMFLSKETVWLPDPTGRIRDELNRESPNLAQIDEIVWDDALVWPLAKRNMGAWIRDTVDVSKINTSRIDYRPHWIGLKPLRGVASRFFHDISKQFQ